MYDAQAIWSSMLSTLEVETNSLNFDVWIKPLKPLGVNDETLVMLAPSENARDEVNRRCLPLIKTALHNTEFAPPDIVIICPDEQNDYVEKPTVVKQKTEQPAFEPSTLNPKYNFENFVVGDSNKLTYAAAQAVAENPGAVHNPLFIYGGVGLGKTHIMNAIGNAVKISHPSLKVLYVSSEKFVNEFIESIRNSKTGNNNAFREKYRSVDVLMIDDVQFISKKPGTQEEIFHTFNDLRQANKAMVFTSDRSPKEIPDLEERVRSRFEWGLITDIQPPDLETRIAILQKKAQEARVNVPANVLAYMADRVNTNIREMESMLNKVIFLSKLAERKPDMELCKEALKDYHNESDSITPDDIINCTCNYFNVSRADLTGKRKNKEVVEPRQIAIYLINDLISLPLATIGDLFGGREHTTVMHARDKISMQIVSDPRIKTCVSDIRAMILGK